MTLGFLGTMMNYKILLRLKSVGDRINYKTFAGDFHKLIFNRKIKNAVRL